jgi:hypothetical protein
MKPVSMIRGGAVALGLTLATTALGAAPIRTTDSGQTASIFAQSPTDIVCADGSFGQVFSSFSVNARQNVVKISGGPSTKTVVEVLKSSFSTCDFVFSTAFGSDDKAIYTQKQATSAKIEGTIPMFDMQNGMPLGNATLSLTLTASANAQKTRRDERNVFGNVTVVTRSTGSFADATVSGSVMLGGENLLATTQDRFANLGDNTTGSVTFTRSTK